MKARNPIRAGSFYRGLRLTVTQGRSGVILWDLYTKADSAHWSEWRHADHGNIGQHKMLEGEREVLTLLVNVLEDRIALLSGRP